MAFIGGAVLKALKKLNVLPPQIINQEPPVLVHGYYYDDFEDIDGAILTLVAAFEFKDHYNNNMIQGSYIFYPFDDVEEEYVLHDMEWEMHVLGVY